ncbi:MAG: NADH-quinone oxidoreductase subunit D [Deltaproteobacteria bacterium]|nr:NADH-quinone oxidoreductase subunit D [Deltaproteobacteria bacterium]
MSSLVTQLKSDEMLLNMGPQHPSTHGVLRFILKTDGEIVTACEPDVGFLHRSIEKICEKCDYPGFMPYTDRVDYLAAMNANHAYALAVERLAGIEVPRRAQVIRVITDELNRIICHGAIGVGALGMDLGAATPFLHAMRERETVNDIIEELCGARLTYNYVRIGGVWFDLPDGFVEKVTAFLNHFELAWEEINRLLTDSVIFRTRLMNVGTITAGDAVSYGLVGPVLRATGIKRDVRRDQPYAIYPELEFDIPVGTGTFGTLGDCFDRHLVRVEEVRQSVKIVRQCLKLLEPGPVIAKVPKNIKPPAWADVYSAVEAPRGEMGFYLMSNGTGKAHRCKIRTGSFAAMSIISRMAPGMMIADLVAFIASLDVVAPEIDR